MPLEIICVACGGVIYSGFDLKSPKEAIRATEGKCKSCGKLLSSTDFTFEVTKVQT
ncbi:MAG TPA: hypothetical protein VFF30_00125 [Nitrososphaerales archaeon]|nr:hypothetical protein [Nitrososphaerales archaeon]